MSIGFQDTVVINGSVITGDGGTFFERGIVRLRDDRITEVREGTEATIEDAFVIDAAGCTILPGIINAHAHGCIHGPAMPSGSAPVAEHDVAYFRNKHLMSGTTTLLNVCGLAAVDETHGPGGERHPLDIHVSSAHTPSNIAAAMEIDGKGLSNRHHALTIETMIADGAKALGEAGGGQTLGGGAQDYRFIPAAILAATGVSVHPKIARSLKEAVLGRSLNGDGAADQAYLEHLMENCGLKAHVDAAAMRELIAKTVLPPVALSLRGFWEIATQSARFGLPAIFHTALPTIETLLKIAATHPACKMVAGHANHPSFSAEEAVHFASELRKRGAAIDVSTLDCVHTRWRNEPDNLDALIEAGLVDTISTDFAGGDWDSILSAVQRMVTKRQLSAPAAVALATGNVARTFPQLAGDRGFIKKGRRADLTICEGHNLSRVRHVMIRGEIAVWNGALIDATGLSWPFAGDPH
jgi:imidazolonepropionase-like amidohydrolase